MGSSAPPRSKIVLIDCFADGLDPAELLEVRIHFVTEILVRAPDRESKLSAYERLRALIGLRSPRVIERMEIERGLRPGRRSMRALEVRCE